MANDPKPGQKTHQDPNAPNIEEIFAVQNLMDASGRSMVDCRLALRASNGNYDHALQWLKTWVKPREI